MRSQENSALSMPNEYTSTAFVMRPWLSSSGGMYGTVPKLWVLRWVALRSSTRLRPKSASLRMGHTAYCQSAFKVCLAQTSA